MAHLSREGAEAIGVLAQRLPTAPILSSDLPRAQETAEILRCESGMTVKFSPLFRELKASCIATSLLGRLWAPTMMWSIVRCCCWVSGIGHCSEGPRSAWDRVARATRKILEHFETEPTIILVSHGWFMILLAIYLRWYGLIRHGPLVPKVGYGAMTEYLLRCEQFEE